MKKVLIILSTMIFSLISCQKEEPAINKEIPGWLTEKIQNDEDYVSQNPKSMLAYGVWVRTEWKKNDYFEYSNGLSSSMYRPISFNNDTLPFLIRDNSNDYFRQKCCAEIVWNGSEIDEEYLKLFHGQ